MICNHSQANESANYSLSLSVFVLSEMKPTSVDLEILYKKQLLSWLCESRFNALTSTYSWNVSRKHRQYNILYVKTVSTKGIP